MKVAGVRAGRAEHVLASRSHAAPRGHKSTLLDQHHQVTADPLSEDRADFNRKVRQDREGLGTHERELTRLTSESPFALFAPFAVLRVSPD